MAGFDIGSLLPLMMAINNKGATSNMGDILSLIGNTSGVKTGGANTSGISQMLPLIMNMMNKNNNNIQGKPQSASATNPQDSALPDALLTLLKKK